MSDTQALWNLAGSYLNQDWAQEFASWQEAVDVFMDDFGPEARTLPDEIRSVLHSRRTDDAVAEYLDSEGWAYVPRGDDGTYRDLLTKIAERAEAGLAKDSGDPQSSGD